MADLLDTNVVIAILKEHPTVLGQVHRAGHEALRLCAPVEAELWFGVAKSERPTENGRRVQTLLSWLTSLPFAGEATQHCGEIRAHLAKLGTPIGPYDAQIAAIARAHGLVLVTRNVREFARVPGLMIENWQD
ncbi:MAG: type II toxin-antitoxin system VapC family toxin [Leptothrix ochracea]|uniref:type II toxin-antitoxin system VapC family toxin n=1 Tax=Leptothrix ochracea TaxID=735331 RepID=UPI0034E2B0B7